MKELEHHGTVAMTDQTPPLREHVRVTVDQIERAEHKLSEVLSGFEYVMPTDGMRQVLEAALATAAEGSADA